MKNLKWNLILMSLLYLALGIFSAAVPGTALNIVCYALGGVVLVCAVVQLVRYFTASHKVFQSQFTLISGLVCLGWAFSGAAQRPCGADSAGGVRAVRPCLTAWPDPERPGPAPLRLRAAGNGSSCWLCSAWCWGPS